MIGWVFYCIGWILTVIGFTIHLSLGEGIIVGGFLCLMTAFLYMLKRYVDQ